MPHPQPQLPPLPSDFKLPPSVPSSLSPAFLQQALSAFTNLYPNSSPDEKSAFIAGWALSSLHLLDTLDAYACAIAGTTPDPNHYDLARSSLEHYTGLTA